MPPLAAGQAIGRLQRDISEALTLPARETFQCRAAFIIIHGQAGRIAQYRTFQLVCSAKQFEPCGS
jgi:hypothetical protein